MKRPNARCFECGSLERHRLEFLYLRDDTDLFDAQLRVLHIAPERCLRHEFELRAGLDYVTSDLYADDVTVNMDIMSIPFEDASFDVVICNHVLEHVEDDRKAMREFRRVLKPRGWALLQSPVDLRRDTTYEDPAIVTPTGRLEHFGQEDHVRVYGRDYAERLREAGFDVTVDTWSGLTAERAQRYALDPGEEILLCAPGRARAAR